MQIHGAIIKEQGATFAIVIVKPQFLESRQLAEGTRTGFRPFFPDMSIVLAAQDSTGRFRYQGRRDLVDFLVSIHPSQIPWKEYTFS